MKIPKKIATPAIIAMSIGILSGSVPMVSYAAEPEVVKEVAVNKEDTLLDSNETVNPVTEDIVYEVYGEVGGGKVSMDEQELYSICQEVASKYNNIDASILHAMCLQESRGRKNVNDVYTSATALGITQIEPSAHEEEIKDLGYSLSDVRNNPQAAIDVTGKILNDRIEARDGDVYKALIDYNMGPNKANEKFAKNPDYKWSYADNVMNASELIKENINQRKDYGIDFSLELM